MLLVACGGDGACPEGQVADGDACVDAATSDCLFPDDLADGVCSYRQDWSGEDLSGNDFSGLTLGGLILVGTNLTDTNLGDSDLSAADLTDAVLVNTALDGTRLATATLAGADLTGATWAGAVCPDVTLAVDRGAVAIGPIERAAIRRRPVP